jgi:hypothetical protein
MYIVLWGDIWLQPRERKCTKANMHTSKTTEENKGKGKDKWQSKYKR